MEISRKKTQLRRSLIALRNKQLHPDAASHHIQEQVAGLPEFRAAQAVSIYVAADSEVHTRWLVTESWVRKKDVYVPVCSGEDLLLCRIESFDQLEPRAFGVWEPTDEIRRDEDRFISIQEVNLIVVPGVGFDSRGRRIGYGKGFYDRLLFRRSTELTMVGLAFDCQIVDTVPSTELDVAMNMVVTQSTVWGLKS